MDHQDLRAMNEEKFVEVFELLGARTNQWTKFPEELLRENPQSLFTIRMVLCLSQSEFAKLLKIDKQWVRHFESGRQGFKKSEIIPKCIRLINRLLKSRNLDNDRVLEFLRVNQDARNKNSIEFPKRNIKFKRIFEMTEEDFKTQFEFLQKETQNFSKFEPLLIIKNPELLATFRVILDMNIPKFSKVIGKEARSIRRWESFKERIMPENAEEIMNNIKNEFKKVKPNLQSSLNNFPKFSFFEPDEINVINALNEIKIPFEIHVDISGHKRKLNVDFAIPNSNNPKLLIEVTRIFDKKFGDMQRRIFFLDHKFQLTKIALPKIKTMMFVICRQDKESVIKGIFDRDIINADFCVVNNVNEVVSKVSQVLEN